MEKRNEAKKYGGRTQFADPIRQFFIENVYSTRTCTHAYIHIHAYINRLHVFWTT